MLVLVEELSLQFRRSRFWVRLREDIDRRQGRALKTNVSVDKDRAEERRMFGGSNERAVVCDRMGDYVAL